MTQGPTPTRRSHRGFVSYIDKSREYYAAQGYDRSYEWAAFADAPFASLTKPLSECRVGVVTTGYFSDPDTVPYVTDHDQAYAAPLSAVELLAADKLSWAKDETHTNDTESFLPWRALQDAIDDRRLGSISPRFYGTPTVYSQRHTAQIDAPAIAKWMAQDHVDIAILVPF